MLLIINTEVNTDNLSFITACNRSLRRLCFHRCLSVHRRVSASGPGGGVSATPPGQTPLGANDPTQTPPEQTPPGQTHPLPSACWDTPPCSVYAGIHTHPCPMHAGIHPRRILCDTVKKWVVRIRLECILVNVIF